MADGTDEFEKVILSAGDNTFSFIGEAYNTEFYTNPYQWGAVVPEPPNPPPTEGQLWPRTLDIRE